MGNFYGTGGFRYTIDGITIPVGSTDVGLTATGGNLIPCVPGLACRFSPTTAGNTLVLTWFGTY